MKPGKAKQIIDKLYVSSTLKGYTYCLYAFVLLSQNPEYASAITKCVYPEIARKYRTTWGCVERNLRTFIEIIWRDAIGEDAEKFFKECFGRKSERRPSNCTFLNAMMRYLERISEEEQGELLKNEDDQNCNEKMIADLEKKMAVMYEENSYLLKENRYLLVENKNLAEKVDFLITQEGVSS